MSESNLHTPRIDPAVQPTNRALGPSGRFLAFRARTIVEFLSQCNDALDIELQSLLHVFSGVFQYTWYQEANVLAVLRQGYDLGGRQNLG